MSHTIFSTNSKPGPASTSQGNGLFASQPIQPGDVILHIQSPFVAVLDTQRLTDTCSGCFGKRQVENEAETRACTGCQVVRYCDRVCFSLPSSSSVHWFSYHSLLLVHPYWLRFGSCYRYRGNQTSDTELHLRPIANTAECAVI